MSHRFCQERRGPGSSGRGRERFGSRGAPVAVDPAELVLTRTSLLGHLGTVTVAALTRTVREVASEVVVGTEHGLPGRCAVNLHNVFTLRRADLTSFLTALPDDVMARVDRAMVFALGIGERAVESGA